MRIRNWSSASSPEKQKRNPKTCSRRSSPVRSISTNLTTSTATASTLECPTVKTLTPPDSFAVSASTKPATHSQSAPKAAPQPNSWCSPGTSCSAKSTGITLFAARQQCYSEPSIDRKLKPILWTGNPNSDSAKANSWLAGEIVASPKKMATQTSPSTHCSMACFLNDAASTNAPPTSASLKTNRSIGPWHNDPTLN